MGWGYAFGAGLDSFAKMVAEAQARAQAHQDQLELLGAKAKLTGVKGAGGAGGAAIDKAENKQSALDATNAYNQAASTNYKPGEEPKGQNLDPRSDEDIRLQSAGLAPLSAQTLLTRRAYGFAPSGGPGSAANLGALDASRLRDKWKGQAEGDAWAARAGLNPDQRQVDPQDFSAWMRSLAADPETKNTAKRSEDAIAKAGKDAQGVIPAVLGAGSSTTIPTPSNLVLAQMAQGMNRTNTITGQPEFSTLTGAMNRSIDNAEQRRIDEAVAKARGTSGIKVRTAADIAKEKDKVLKEKTVGETVSNVVTDLTAKNGGKAPTDDEVRAALPDLSPEQIAAARSAPRPTGRTTPVGVAAAAAKKKEETTARSDIANARAMTKTVGKGVLLNEASVGAMFRSLKTLHPNGEPPSAKEIAEGFGDPLIQEADVAKILAEVAARKKK